ncbi:peptidoglycan/LPS O-acetylase OafA/YrhL [Streptosporangium album]|uniref:Peptidoglycan/LPS O-acetylase OafA/YrhL n=1 Tax=Streptosporangium album TaxID=47479 RepID=A0A7W7W6V2_9ACTN|nr:acyltransferase family protein [Streptosporangium album]MBB4936208.1 peptidoglycan/LPS O-acetylase OafA/YrhL [Streptosporangium album]
MTVTAKTTTARLRYIDNLRVALTALVVLHHVALTYGNIPLWFYAEPAKDSSGVALDILVTFDQAFFMGLFFLISGFFTPGAYDRKGTWPFLRDRLMRLGVPLLIFLLLVRPLVNFGSYSSVEAASGVTDLPYWLFYLFSWDPGPMWFVEVLLGFAALYALWRHFARPVSGADTPAAPGARAVIAFALGLAAVTFLWRLAVPIGAYWPVVGLPSPAYLPQYAGLFAVGVLAHRRRWLEALTPRAGRLGFLTAGVVTLVLLPLSAVTGGALQTLAVAVWDSVFAVALAIGLLWLFRKRFDRQGPRGRFLSEHAYAVYFVHPVVLVGLGYAFRPLDAPAVVKFAVMAAFALPLCWGLAYAVRSLPGARRVL